LKVPETKKTGKLPSRNDSNTSLLSNKKGGKKLANNPGVLGSDDGEERLSGLLLIDKELT
jgi:hypothetical protein